MELAGHILIVDDDAEIRRLLSDYLRKNGFRTTAVGDGEAMREALARSRTDVIVLDLMLPGEDGLVLCRNLRAESQIPIIMLTAKGEETDRIVGLEMGADDYLPKPFSPRELLARIKSVLRRVNTLPHHPRFEKPRLIRFGSWRLDTVARHLLSHDGIVVPLSGAEFRLLSVFLEHPNRVLNRDQLMDLTRGGELDPSDRSIDVQVSRLRRRLGDDAKEPSLIKTVRGEGYVMSTRVETET
jgi:two-component system, OmpR family, response regulator